MKSKTDQVKDFIREREFEKAIKLAGSWRWNKSDEDGQKIIMAREVLLHRKSYESLYKSRNINVDDIYKEGLNALLCNKQFVI